MKKLIIILFLLLITTNAWSAQFLFKTIEEDGNGDYTTLEACMNANEQDLTGDGWFDVEIVGTELGGGGWDANDSTAVVIHNYTTTADDYINIYTTATARHNGTIASGYHLSSSTDFVHTINCSDDFITINGLIISTDEANSNSIHLSAANNCVVKNCIIPDAGSGIRFSTFGHGSHKVYNNIIYNCTVGINDTRGDSNAARRCLSYNNTAYGCTTGIDTGLGTDVVNNISHTNTTDFVKDGGAWVGTSDYNFSKDDTAPAGNAIHGDTDGKTPDFVDAVIDGGEDFHLQSTSDAIDVGTDLGDTYDLDIDGTSRDATTPWDIGADEFVSEVTTIPQIIINIL